MAFDHKYGYILSMQEFNNISDQNCSLEWQEPTFNIPDDLRQDKSSFNNVEEMFYNQPLQPINPDQMQQLPHNASVNGTAAVLSNGVRLAHLHK